MNPGTSCRKISGTLNASHIVMKRAALSAESTKIAPLRTCGWLATIPTTWPSRRPSPTTISSAQRGLISKNEPASTSPSDDVTDVVAFGLGRRCHTRPVGAGRPGGSRGRRSLLPAVGQVGQQQARRGDGFPIGAEHLVRAAGDGGVHYRAAHLLQRGPFTGDLLRDPWRRQVHGRVALDHAHPVGERRHVRAAGGRWAEQAADLRHPPGQGDLQVEDEGGPTKVGEEAELVGQAPARRVDQVDHGEQVPVGPLQNPDLLLTRQPAPGPGLDREVVRDDGNRTAVDAAYPGPHAVGGHALGGGVREQTVLPPASRVQQDRQPVSDRQLARPAARVVAAAGRRHGTADRFGPLRCSSLLRCSSRPSAGHGHPRSPLARISSWISSVPPPMRSTRASR